ncbi:MAG TPA: hypothetical protein VGO14_03165 [Solirubrobacteraceae bacterium]|nr:hypothetical protein [Solirubrobacteraceae bacterium]
MSARSAVLLPTVLCAAGASLALAACGGSSPAATKRTAEESMVKFARCMREHGVNVPTPTPGQPVRFTSSNPQAMDAAQNACKRYTAAQEPSPADQAAHLEAGRKFARCMRSHGIQVPDPSTTQGGVAIKMNGGPGSINPSSPAFQAAQTACQSLLGKNAPKAGLSVQSSGSGGPKGGGSAMGVYAPGTGR